MMHDQILIYNIYNNINNIYDNDDGRRLDICLMVMR